METELKYYAEQASSLIEELVEKGNLKKGSVIVFGCSTSEILGSNIGKNSSEEIGDAIATAIINKCNELNMLYAFQCCEHLNRALVTTEEVLNKKNLCQVNVKPQLKAGGGVATAAYNKTANVCMVMSIQAEAVVDIGDTIVGMHIKPVAVPVRPSDKNKKIGEANVVMAYSRLPYIGGPRALY